MDCELCEAMKEPRVVFRDEHMVVLVNIEPLKKGHVIVQPIRHVADLRDLSAEESEAFLKTINRCTEALSRAFPEQDPIVILNGWKQRTQHHLHIHVLPNTFGVRGLFEKAENLPHRVRQSPDTLQKMAEELKTFFNE